jgi:phage terminase large subunit
MGRKKNPPENSAETPAEESPPDIGPPPWNWQPRPYQLSPIEAFDRGILRQFHAWHRRAGKDSTALQLSAVGAWRRPATYWHLFPQQTQARKAIWNGIDNDGRKFLDQAFPLAVRKKTRDQEMLIELTNGSTWQMAGSDNYNSLVGSNVRGVVLSEWALCDPQAWPYIQPILRENGGWAIFITTFRGKNHAWRMYQNVKDLPDWHCTFRTVEDTCYPDGRRIITAEDIEKDRREGMDDATIRSEYYLDPSSGFAGSYYGKALNEMEQQDRLSATPYDPSLPLFSAWHVAADVLACILVQTKGTESRIVGSRDWKFTTVHDALADLRQEIPFSKQMRSCVISNCSERPFELAGFEVSRIMTPELNDGIETVRRTLPVTRIDNEPRPFVKDGVNNERLVDSLRGFRTVEKNEVFQKKPAQTWEAVFAEAVQTWSVFVEDGGTSGWGRPPDYSQQDRAVI